MFKLFTGNWLIWALLAGVASFVGWRWLEVRETLAVERAQFRQERAQFEYERSQFQNQERIAREASNAYQTQLAASQANARALAADNRGLRLVAYRSLQPFPAAPGRLEPASEEPERGGGTVVDLARLDDLARRCEADAIQLDSLIQWTRSLNASR